MSQQRAKKFGRAEQLSHQAGGRVAGGAMPGAVVEWMEDRTLLSIAVPVLPGAEPLANLANQLIQIVYDALPEDVRDGLPARFERDLRAMDSSFIYQAFPGETNDVRMRGEWGNSFLMLNESGDVAMVRVPPGISPDVIKSLKLSFTTKVEGGGSFVAHLAGGIGLNFEGLLDASFKNLLQLPKADLIVVNGLAFVDVVPGLNDLVDSFNAILDFDVSDYFQDDLLVIPSWSIPNWVPLLGGVKIFPGFSIPIPEFVDDVFTVFPSSLREVLDLMPDSVQNAVSNVVGVLDFLQTVISTSGVTVSTLDGNDRIDLSGLTGVPQTVLAGPGNDTILCGGGQNILSTWGLTLYDSVNDKPLEFYGDEGNDTFYLNRNFNSGDTLINGGTGSDRIVIEGTAFADIVRLIAKAGGGLAEVRFETPNENPGILANEVQLVALPGNVVGGTFTLKVDGLGVTAPIAWNATTGDVMAALVNIGIGAADLAVSGSPGTWAITFTGALGHTDLGMLRADGSNLQRLGPAATVATVQEANPLDGLDEVQRIVLPGQTTGGTFKLRLDSLHAWTAPIQHDAAAAAVKAALLATAPELASGDLQVTGTGPIWWVTFTGALGASDRPALQADGLGLSGGLEVGVGQTTAAAAAVNEKQRITLTGETGGAFRLGFTHGGATRWTGLISNDALPAEIEVALASLATIGAGNVDVTGTAGGPWIVEFTGELGGQDQPTFLGDISGLSGSPMLELTQIQAASAGANQVQTITLPAEAAGGTFELWFQHGGDIGSTGPLAYTATAAQLQSALQAIEEIGADNVSVTGPAGGPWNVEFTGDWARTTAPLLTADGSALRGGLGGEISVQEASPGSTVNEIQRVQLAGTTTGGTFTLSFEGHTTAPIAHDADGVAVKAALTAAGIAGTDLSVAGPAGGPWDIEFVGARSAQDQPAVAIDAGLVRYIGGTVDVSEQTKGNDGAETVVLHKTVFTDLVDVESLIINGGDGDDTLILDNTAGPIHFAEGIQFNGGGGSNQVVLLQQTPVASAGSSEHKSGLNTIRFGLAETDEQALLYSSSRIYDLIPGEKIVVNGGTGRDSIELTRGDYGGTPVGLIRSDSGLSVYFANKQALAVLTGAGDDLVTVQAGALPPGLTALTIDGQSSTDGDSLLINGSDGDDLFDFTPTSMRAGTLALTIGGATFAVELAGLESFHIDGQGQADGGDQLVVRAAQVQVVPGGYPGAGEVTARGASGMIRLAAEYVNMESVDAAVLDVVVFEGTAGDDMVTVTAGQVIFTDLFGHANATGVAGAGVVLLHLMDGNDVVTVQAATALPFQLEVLGGGGDSGGDVLDFTGAGDALSVRLDDASLSAAGGTRLTFTGVEQFDIDTAGGPLSLEGTADDERLTVTALTSDAGRLAFDDSALRFRYRGLEGLPVAIDLGAGEDVLTVAGSAAGDEITLDCAGVRFTDDGRAFTYANTEALLVLGREGNDRLTIDNSQGLLVLPGHVRFDGGPGLDVLAMVGTLAVDTITYEVGPAANEGTVTHTLDGQTQKVYFTELEPVIDLVAGALVVNGTGGSDVIGMDVGPNSGSVPGGFETALVTVGAYEGLEFGNKSSLTINALAGHDTVDLANLTSLVGLAGVTVDGGAGDDLLIGSAGDDLLIGGRGDDTLRGEDGADTLLGGEGNDALLGGDGDDLMDGGPGANSLDGGGGIDTAEVFLTEADDTAAVSPAGFTVNGAASSMTRVENIRLDALGGDDTVEVDVSEGIPATVTIRGGPGDDTLNATIANPAPMASVLLDGGDHRGGDSATVTGLFGDDQFTEHGDVNVFGHTVVSLVQIENPAVLESRRIDGTGHTAEARRWAFLDADGNLTTVAIEGPGIADIYRDIYASRQADIFEVRFADTARFGTGLRVNVARRMGADNKTSIRRVTGTGIGSFLAPSSDLTEGIWLSRGVRSLQLGDVNDGARIDLGGMSAERLMFHADHVGNVDFATDGFVYDMNVAAWDAGRIQGAVFRTVQTRAGGFGATLQNTRMNRRDFGIYNLTVRGGDLNAGMVSDRIRSVQVIDGNASLSVVLTSDAATLRGVPAIQSVSITGGDLMGAVFDMEDGTLLANLSVRGRGGVGGSITGALSVQGNLGNTAITGSVNAVVSVAGNAGNTTIGGNLETGGWTVGGSMGDLSVGGTVRAAGLVASIRSGQSMGRLAFGAIEHVDVLAGIAPAIRFADEPGEFIDPSAFIRSVTIGGLPGSGPLPRFMSDSHFSAAGMGTLKIVNADLATAGLYACAAGGFGRVVHRDTVDPSRSFVYPSPGPLPIGPSFINIV